MKKRTPKTTSIESLPQAELISISSFTLSLINDIEHIYNQPVDAGDDISISTGVPELDAQIGYLRRGKLLAITVPNDQMRDAFCLTVIQHVALRLCQPVVFFGGQDPLLTFFRKLIDVVAEIPSEASIYDGKLSKDELQRLSSALVELSNAPIFTNQTRPLTLDQICDATKFHHQQTGGIGLVLIDYLQCLADSNPIAAIIRLKKLAGELKVPIIALHKWYPSSYIRDFNTPIPKELQVPALTSGKHYPVTDTHDFQMTGYFEQLKKEADLLMMMSGSPENIIFSASLLKT
ncbi:MAG: DnaB-like helicase C-terminal domain-containing protein [Methylococcaceae bacterium]